MSITVSPYYEYYKSELEDWVQPKFAANDLTVDDMVYKLTASHESAPAWNAFNQSLAPDNCWWTKHGVTSTSNPCWICISFNKKMVMSELKILNENQTPENFKLGYLQVSNNKKSWKTINTIHGVNQGNYTITVPINEKEPFYHFRLYFTESYSSGGVSIQTLTYKGKVAKNTFITNEANSDFERLINGDIEQVYFGNKKIKKIYKGSTLVFEETPFNKYPPTIWLKNRDWNSIDGKVTSWKDESGLLNPSQTDTNRQPTVIDNAINGRPAVHFQNQFLNTKRIVIKKAYSVIKFNDKWQVTAFDITATRDNYYPLGRGIVLTSIYGGVGGSFPNYVGSGGYFDVRDKVQGWVNGGGNGFNADNYAFGDPWRGVHKQFRGSYWLFPNRYEDWVGTYEGAHISYTAFLTCDIAEVILYNHAVEAATHEKIMTYLRNKYGIQE